MIYQSHSEGMLNIFSSLSVDKYSTLELQRVMQQSIQKKKKILNMYK